MKADNNQIKESDKRIRKIRKLMDNYEKDLRELKSDLKDKHDDEQQKQKYEILYKKDKEMENYIKNFNANR